MRLAGRLKLGFYPLPVKEAGRISLHLQCPPEFAAVDPCVGDGIAFSRLLQSTNAQSYGIEIDAYRAEQAAQLGIQVVQANAMTVRCPAESISLLYLNPPYDFEAGHQANKRLELVFLEHTYRWLKPKGVLVFVLPQAQLRVCAKLLAEHFAELRVYRLTEPECTQYQQLLVLASRRPRHVHLEDSALLQTQEYLRRLAEEEQIASLTDVADATYSVPPSGPTTLTDHGIPLDRVEDLLPQSAAYRLASRVLIREQSSIKGRPLTPLHGGHVSLLATAGMLNGVFGTGEDRHIAHWRSVKFVDHWEEEEPNGTIIKHDRERFSHELSLAFVDGRTQILTHGKESDDQ
jgi:tRNA1(Val) A37 N6-methylase TrmN6